MGGLMTKYETYEMRKTAWLAKNPQAKSEEYEVFIKQLTKELKL